MFNDLDFIYDCQKEHGGTCRTESLFNVLPEIYWLVLFNDANYVKFMNGRGIPRYRKVKPLWQLNGIKKFKKIRGCNNYEKLFIVVETFG